MRHILKVEPDHGIISLASTIVYGQRGEWCGTKYRQLSLSLMKPRCHYSYDEDQSYPVIVWLCGGSFAEVDRNIWIPELVDFVRSGYAVASIDYSTQQLVRFPDQLNDIQEAISFLRIHAEELHIRPDKIAVMGESAGGYLSGLVALERRNHTDEATETSMGSPQIQAAVCWYPCVDMKKLLPDREKVNLPEDIANYPNLCDLVETGEPPFLILHGLSDSLVPYEHSEMLYRALTEKGNYAELYLLQNANHADHVFVSRQMKEIMIEFLDKILKPGRCGDDSE